MRTIHLAASITLVAFAAAGCDPEAPVESSDVNAEIAAAIAVHAGDQATHTNLLLNASNISGEFDENQIAENAITNEKLAPNAVGTVEISDQSIGTDDLGAGAVTGVKIANLTISAGNIQLATIGAAQMAPASITGGAAGVIVDNSITVDDIATGGVGAAEIADGTVASLDIADNSIADGDIAANTITAGSIANDAIGAGELANNAVDTAAIANAAVDDTKLAANSVITAKILDANVTTAKIADANVTAGKLAALSVTQAKIDSDFVGRRVDATTGALNTVFVFTEPAGGAAINIEVVGACESTEAGSIVQLGDQTAACPDVGNNNAIDGTPVLFRIVFNANNENVTFGYDAGANNETVAWEIYSFTVSGNP